MPEDYILDALDMVAARDIPDEDFAQAVNDQEKLMACMNPGQFGRSLTDTSIHSLPATLPSSLPNNTDQHASAQQQRTSLVRRSCFLGK